MIGVLALQGDFEAHARVLRHLGADVAEVRRAADLKSLQGLVLPGGESSTLLNLMEDEPWFPAIRALHGRGGALLGTCAGAILLARQVTSPAQPSLGLLDAVIERNAYGRQADSFETTLEAPALGGPLSGVFIRAPRFRSLGRGVTVLASHEGEPVLVQEGRVIAGTFHPELAGEGRLHRHFLDIAHAARRRYRAAASG